MTQSRRMLVLARRGGGLHPFSGSREAPTSLTRDHDLGVQFGLPIRNDMAALEDQGYLIQPTLPAGRVPTERAIDTLWTDFIPWCRSARRKRRGINSFLSGSVSPCGPAVTFGDCCPKSPVKVAVVASPSLAKGHIAARGDGARCQLTTLLAVVITDTGRVA